MVMLVAVFRVAVNILLGFEDVVVFILDLFVVVVLLDADCGGYGWCGGVDVGSGFGAGCGRCGSDYGDG
jgi:hypothetical protein